MSPTGPWPSLPEEDRWVLELMEERLEDTWPTPEQLQARAKELRVEAGATDINGIRGAALLLADRFEAAAAARIASS